jgi:cytochrome c-type biogenesis protein CcsB
MNLLWFNLALSCYLAGTVIYFSYIAFQRKFLHYIGYAILAVGFFAQTLFFIFGYVQRGYFPVVEFGEALSFFAWAIAGVFLGMQLKFNVRILGSFVTPLCTVLMICSRVLPQGAAVAKPLYKSIWLAIHVSTIFLGNGIFAVAFVVAIMYLLQERQIKTKKHGFFFHRLPSLTTLDSMNYYCIMVGFPLLTLGMITGSIYAQTALGTFWRWDPKEVWSLATWLLYAALLHERLTVGWRGRRTAIMAIVGFLVLLFSLIGVNFLLKGYHSFATLGGGL